MKIRARLAAGWRLIRWAFCSNSGWVLFPWIGLVLVVYLSLQGCASVPTRTELLIYRNHCTGKDHAATVDVFVGAPLFACPARAAELGLHADAWLYGIAGAFGCAFWGPENAWRVRAGEVYVGPGEPFLAHELQHVRQGAFHSPLTPWIHNEGCGS